MEVRELSPGDVLLKSFSKCTCSMSTIETLEKGVANVQS